MITAKQMATISIISKIGTPDTHNQITEIEKKITIEAHKGNYQVEIQDNITESVMEILKRNDYIIDKNDKKITIIRW